MSKQIRKMFYATSIACGLLAAGTVAAQQSGLVTVNIEDNEILNNIANDLNVEVSQIPVTVQVPVGIAANVCNVDANVLAQQKGGGDATCTAENTSTALNQVIQRQMKQQGSGQ